MGVIIIDFSPFRLLMMGIYAGYMYLAVYGTLSITSKLDTEKILPKDTPIHRPNRIIESIGELVVLLLVIA